MPESQKDSKSKKAVKKTIKTKKETKPKSSKKKLEKSVAKSTSAGAFSLIGGGDSVAAIKKCNLQEEVSFISTGGGAMLESLEGKILPGIKALN